MLCRKIVGHVTFIWGRIMDDTINTTHASDTDAHVRASATSHGHTESGRTHDAADTERRPQTSVTPRPFAGSTTADAPPSPETPLDEEDDLRQATAAPPQEPVYDGRMLSQALMSGGRAFSHAVMHVGGTRQRAGRFWMIVFGMLILMALLVVLAHYKHREIKLGYELSQAISEREALLEENRKLRIELRVQSSRDRLEPMASRQLGLTQIRPEQILFLKHTSPSADAPQNRTATKRLDGLDRVKLLEDE